MEDIESHDHARQIAGLWHSGQWSPFYAYCSSGHFDYDSLCRELSQNMNNPDLTDFQREELQALDRWFEKNRPETDLLVE